MSRYLTATEKEATVNFWLLSREATLPTTDLAEEHILMGGFDWPDPPIFPYTDRINALDGICTLSSCVGHQWVTEIDVFSDGHLWFRLSEKNSKIFEKHVIELAREPSVTTLRKSYSLAESKLHWEWYEVEFWGGAATLPERIEPILSFFERLFPVTLHPVSEGETAAEPDALRSVLTAPLEATGTEA